jgi:hypothetical protein
MWNPFKGFKLSGRLGGGTHSSVTADPAAFVWPAAAITRRPIAVSAAAKYIRVIRFFLRRIIRSKIETLPNLKTPTPHHRHFSYLQTTGTQALSLVLGVGHDQHMTFPWPFTHSPKYVPLGCFVQLQLGSSA